MLSILICQSCHVRVHLGRVGWPHLLCYPPELLAGRDHWISTFLVCAECGCNHRCRQRVLPEMSSWNSASTGKALSRSRYLGESGPAPADLQALELPREVLERASARLSRIFQIVPFEIADGVVTFAIPSLEDLEQTGLDLECLVDVDFRLARYGSSITQAIDRHYPRCAPLQFRPRSGASASDAAVVIDAQSRPVFDGWNFRIRHEAGTATDEWGEIGDWRELAVGEIVTEEGQRERGADLLDVSREPPMFDAVSCGSCLAPGRLTASLPESSEDKPIACLACSQEQLIEMIIKNH